MPVIWFLAILSMSLILQAFILLKERVSIFIAVTQLKQTDPIIIFI